MLKKESSTLCFEASTMKGCDMCGSAPCTVFCKADLAYLCSGCDLRMHAANKLSSRHERVWVCQLDHPADSQDELFDGQKQNPNGNINSFSFKWEEGVDEYLDLVEYNSCQDSQFSEDQYSTNNNNNSNNHDKCDSNIQDSVVPIGFEEQKFQLGMEYESSKAGYGYHASLSHSVSMSPLDVGIIPDSTIMEGFSNPTVQMATQLTPMDREARVLRYREKKKTRKFEKTIRYASRKAYAETRPRVKGRFAKRTDVDVNIEVDQMFATSLVTDGGYCVVPSF